MQKKLKKQIINHGIYEEFRISNVYIFMENLEAISAEQKNNQKANSNRFDNLEQQIEAVLDKLATMAAWNEPLD